MFNQSFSLQLVSTCDKISRVIETWVYIFDTGSIYQCNNLWARVLNVVNQHAYHWQCAWWTQYVMSVLEMSVLANYSLAGTESHDLPCITATWWMWSYLVISSRSCVSSIQIISPVTGCWGLFLKVVKKLNEEMNTWSSQNLKLFIPEIGNH